MIEAGARFDRLLVLKYIPGSRKQKATVLCICDCGKETSKNATSVRRGLTRSCGCLWIETRRESGRRVGKLGLSKRHGHSVGYKRSKTYRVWTNMKSRVQNPKVKEYPLYGGRGIGICQRWLESFENFLVDMGECPKLMSLERKNNDGDYESDNCKWATVQEQANNRRTNRLITIDGTTLTLSQWSDISGKKPATISARLKKGWEPKRAVMEALCR